MIHVRNLSVRLGHRLVLDTVSFAWERGLLAIIGANGSGKSTLLRAVIGAIDRVSGEVEIDQRSLAHERDALQRRCALVAEEPSYPGHLTVAELVGLCAGLRRSEVPTDERSRETMERIGSQQYRTLSLGQRKRAHLLMARVESPAWWLLDEPSDGLDRDARAGLFDELRERGTGALIATHDDELIAQCDGVLRVIHGKTERVR